MTADPLSEVRKLTDRIVEKQRRADGGKFKGMGEAMELQRLRRDRSRLQQALPLTIVN